MRLRILATIAIDPLFEIIRTIVAINSCTSPRSHFGTSSVPPSPPWARTLQVHFLLALNRRTHPARGHPFARHPLGSPQLLCVFWFVLNPVYLRDQFAVIVLVDAVQMSDRNRFVVASFACVSLPHATGVVCVNHQSMTQTKSYCKLCRCIKPPCRTQGFLLMWHDCWTGKSEYICENISCVFCFVFQVRDASLSNGILSLYFFRR